MATKFRILRGLEANLPKTCSDGKLYISTDTGAIYVDNTTSRDQVGGTVTKITAGTDLIGGDIKRSGTISHAAITRTDGTATAENPGYGKTFNVVDSITTSNTGHVTSVKTKTITMPSVQDTTYKAGTGLALNGTTFNHSNSVTAGSAQGSSTKTLKFGDSFELPIVTYDAQGHITGKGTTTITMPADPNTDTHYTSKNIVGKSTATSNTTSVLSNGSVFLNHIENSTLTSSHSITGKGGTQVVTDAKGNIIIDTIVDTYLDGASTNPVQNGVITTWLNDHVRQYSLSLLDDLGTLGLVASVDNSLPVADIPDVAPIVKYIKTSDGTYCGIGTAWENIYRFPDIGSSTKPVYFTSTGLVECGDVLGVSITGNAATASKVQNQLAINVNGTTTNYDGSTSQTIEINADKLGLSSAMHFKGVLTSLPTVSTSDSYNNGDVVLVGNKEYVRSGKTSSAAGTWVELGDESSHALKTIKINPGAGLTGGGTLEEDRTLSLAASGVTAGTYGTAQSPSHGGTFAIPSVTVDAYGRITKAGTVNITLPNTKLSGGTAATADATVVGGVTVNDHAITVAKKTLKASTDNIVVLNVGGDASSVTYTASHAKKGPSAGYTSGNTVTSINGSGGSGTIKIPQITVDTYGHVTAAADEDITITLPTLSTFGITATAAELNALDGITATVTELNYVDGVTSNIQTQLNNKIIVKTWTSADIT